MDGLGFNCCCSGGATSTCLAEDNYELFVSGDTAIGPHVYQKLYKLGYYAEYLFSTTPFNCPTGCVNYNPVFYGNVYMGGIRQDIPARKVYFHPPQAGTEDTLLYDFNLDAGDFLPASYTTEAGVNLVSSIDSVLVGNEYHRRFWLDYDNHAGYAAIIEGIGSTYGLLTPLVPPFEFTTELVCVKIDAQPVYPDTQTSCSLSGLDEKPAALTYSFFPNPVSDIAVLQLDNQFRDAEVVIYSLSGKEVKRQRAVDGIIEIHQKDFEAGTYFFKVTGETGQTGTGKFLVAR